MRRAAIIGIMTAALAAAGLGSPALAQSTTPQSGAALAAGVSDADLRALVEAARESAKASRENVEYARVVPDLLTHVLAKLDKLENKLDKIENAIKADGAPRRSAR